MTSDNSLHGRPTAAELVAAVAEFIESDVREATTGQVNFHARVAANVLRTVERELLDTGGGDARAAMAGLGFGDEAALAAAIRAGELDERAGDVHCRPADPGATPVGGRPSWIRRRIDTTPNRSVPMLRATGHDGQSIASLLD